MCWVLRPQLKFGVDLFHRWLRKRDPSLMSVKTHKIIYIKKKNFCNHQRSNFTWFTTIATYVIIGPYPCGGYVNCTFTLCGAGHELFCLPVATKLSSEIWKKILSKYSLCYIVIQLWNYQNDFSFPYKYIQYTYYVGITNR